ncbi:diguanylate cyclase domain-containing protein [Cupriavidus sp. RAF12]|uniref:diguanylate cyclase domain-containing protein n=1 Tax=Cupriavidus sp. RAF12 TaxID=3233050 RepID=UPI003F92B456
MSKRDASSMLLSGHAYSAPRWRFTRWIAEPGRDTPAEIRKALVGSLFGTLSIFFGGVINTLMVALVITLHLKRPEFYAWLALEAGICASRIVVLFMARRAAQAGRPTPTDLHLVLSLAWAGSVGLGAYLSVTSGDWLAAALACLSCAAMCGGICFRNYGAPRMTALMILLSLGPICLGAIVAAEPLFLLTLLQLPVYILSMTNASLRMNAMVVATMRSERENAHRAHHDSLTGLLNRASLLAEIRDASTRRLAAGRFLTLLYLDLDGFKLINDSHGHGCGDELLIRVGERLRGAVPGRGLVYRIGGDEFVILLRNETEHSVQALAQELLHEVGTPYLLPDGLQAQLGVSIGIAHVRPEAHTADAILSMADRALYRAKAQGRGQYRFAAAL